MSWSQTVRVTRKPNQETEEICFLCGNTKVNTVWEVVEKEVYDSDAGGTFTHTEESPIKIKSGVYWPDNPYQEQYIICNYCVRKMNTKKGKDLAWDKYFGKKTDYFRGRKNGYEEARV